MKNLEKLASTIVNCSIGLTAISSICVFIPNPNIKQFAAFGVGVGFSGIAATQTVTTKATKELERQAKTSKAELQDKINALDTASNLLSQKQKELNQATEVNQTLIAEIKTLMDTQTLRTLEIEALRIKVEDFSNRLIQTGKFTKDEAINLVTVTFDNSIKKLDALLNALQRNHPAIADSFNNLRAEIDKFKNYYLTQLDNYQGLTNLQELLDTGLILQEKIIERSCDLKLKAQTMVIWHLNEKINDSVSFEEYERNLQQLGEKATNEIRQRELDKEAIAQEWVESNEETVYNYETNFTEVMSLAKYSAVKQQELVNQIQALESEVAELKKPRQWRLANTRETQTGNFIIDFFYKQHGIVLDRCYYTTDGFEADIYFHCDRNPEGTVLAKQLEPDAEYLGQIKRCLQPIKFEFDVNEQLMKAHIVMYKKPKKEITEKDYADILGSPEEFIKYIVNHPIRYRLIADPGKGKTPTTAVMIGEIIKKGCTQANTGKGQKVPNTLVTVSYPGAQGSLKDADYPLEQFLQYVDSTAAVKSFDDCLDDGKFRQQNTSYAAEFFQIWVWDEFDNTIKSSDEPKATGENIKHILKQFGHNNIGWIVSGQSVMTGEIPGFRNDDRTLFTEIIIDIPKIRKYLETYGKETLSDLQVENLTKNLNTIQPYVNDRNSKITDDARLIRVALVLDSRSPKLYILPNLDNVDIDANAVVETRRLAEMGKRARRAATKPEQIPDSAQNPYPANTDQVTSNLSFSPIVPSDNSGTKPHCIHCGSPKVTQQRDKRYYCSSCRKKSAESKVVWK